jgi:hypothetical protein
MRKNDFNRVLITIALTVLAPASHADTLTGRVVGIADGLKGYSKAAGSWFNERFLGRKLKIKRDGKKTFHSLRHCFITATERLDTPHRVVDQLVGHERGKTQSMSRYAKDRNATELQPLINKLVFPCLSDIVPFNVHAGLKALKSSERHKASVAR